MRKRGWTITAIMAGAALLVGGGVLGFTSWRAQATQAQACEAITAQLAERGEVVTVAGDAPRVAIVGDSYATGDGLAGDWQSAWPYQLASSTGYAVDVAGVGYTGFAEPGMCGDQAFNTRATVLNGADIAILQGGLNDARTGKDVTAATEELLADADATRIIVVGPVEAPSIDGEAAVDDQLRKAAEASGATYLSALEWDVEFGPDGIHMTEQGHATFSENVAAALG